MDVRIAAYATVRVARPDRRPKRILSSSAARRVLCDSAYVRARASGFGKPRRRTLRTRVPPAFNHQTGCVVMTSLDIAQLELQVTQIPYRTAQREYE
jgi:hypothetical protein